MDFSIGTYINVLRSNLNLNTEKTAGGNYKTLISNIDMKIGSNTNIRKARVLD